MLNERKLIEYIPLISGFTVLAGILKAITYYWVFGIRIIPFLELSECLLMFLDDIILASAFLLIEFLIIMAFDSETPQKVNKEPASAKFLITLVLISIIIMWSLAIYIFNLTQRAMVLGIISTFVVVSFFGSMILFEKLKTTKYLNSNEDFLRMKTFFGGWYFLSIMATWGAIEGYNLKFRSSKFQDFSIITKSNKVYKSSDSLFYIGKTSNYLFIGNKKIDQNTVIPNEEVSEIKIGHKQSDL
jgi:hypothetical protein